MDALAQQLLSGTGLPHHHDIGVRLGKGLGLLDTGYHPRAAGDDIPEGVLGLVSLVVELFAQLVLRGLDLRGVQQGNHSSSPEAVHHHVFRFDGQVGVFVSDNLVRVLRRGHDAAQRRGGEHGGCRLSQILFPAGELQNLDGSCVQKGDLLIAVDDHQPLIGVVQHGLEAQGLLPFHLTDLGLLLGLRDGVPECLPAGGNEHGGQSDLLRQAAAGAAADDDPLPVSGCLLHTTADLQQAVLLKTVRRHVHTQLAGQLLHAQDHVLGSQDGGRNRAVLLPQLQ